MRALFLTAALAISSAALMSMPSTATAQVSAADNSEIDTKVAAFFKSWNEDKTDAGYKAFMLPAMNEQPTLLRNLVSVSEQVTDYFGAPFKYEQVAEGELGNRLVYRKYLLYNDKAPYMVSIVMYHTSTGWYGQTVTMRDLTVDDVANAAP